MAIEVPHILLVEDSESVAYALQRYFEHNGYYVTVANNGMEALEISKDIAIDGLITDFKMPKMNGLDVIRKIREYQPNLPILIVSAYIAEIVHLKDKNTRIFEKPVDMGRLLECIGKLLGKVLE